MIAQRKAFAKINLTLEIGEKRQDGYHSLTSVMARVTLADVVSVEKNDLQTVRIFTDNKIINNSDNLCVKAANAYFKAKGISNGADIFLDKHIPIASGLGGGSADAAATLECMEELFGALDYSTRFSIARSLGADVPYCLKKMPCLCTGIGDICAELDVKSTDGLWLIISKKGEKLSTGKVYSDFDALEKCSISRDHSAVIQALESGDIKKLAKSTFNDFERVVIPTCNDVAEERNRLISLGALSVMMSGAGPALVAFFDDFEKARKCGTPYSIITQK